MMSGDAASLPCPICSHTGVFDSAQSLRDKLIHVSTNKILCPVCQEEICGLDKLTIHLFSHVKLLKPDIKKSKLKPENDIVVQQKKPRSEAKNKPSASIVSAPAVKYVKIYPKLPVISVNSVLPILDISQRPVEEGVQTNREQPIIKTEAQVMKSNTTCDVCGLQFVDKNILKMHRCIIHNIEDTSQSATRYNCHICPKNFKMRGSLMVHLRVAHFGFLNENSNMPENDVQNNSNGKMKDQQSPEKCSSFDRNDNKQWQCEVCRKYFTTKYFLKKHKRLHTGETPYACTQCNKTFTFQQSYHKHLLYHNDEKPHTCSYCGRAFKELSTLHNHQRIHTGEKPFACETCGKCFRQRVSYLVHRRIHTGVMPYKCTACDKNFRYKVSQRTHKCQAQPPGTVVRQTGDLVEKLKKKHIDPETVEKQSTNDEFQDSYLEISEVNAEMARTGAKLSLEDLETDSFRIFSEPFDNDAGTHPAISCSTEVFSQKENQERHTNVDLVIDKNIPSPSDILKNLCLSNDDDFSLRHERNDDIMKDLSEYL